MLENKTEGPDQGVEEVFQACGNMLYRIAFVMMKNAFDAEDVVQDTLIKYMEHLESGKSFETEEHRKAWLIRVNSNLCKNRLRFYKNHPKISVEQLSRYYEKEEDTALMDSLMLLPSKYREVLLLHYVEGYQGGEIAGMLGVCGQKTPGAGTGKAEEDFGGDTVTGRYMRREASVYPGRHQ